MEVAVQIFLNEDTSRCSKGHISHDEEGFGVVREGKHGFFEESLLYFGESHFMIDRPLPLGIFVGEEK